MFALARGVEEAAAAAAEHEQLQAEAKAHLRAAPINPRATPAAALVAPRLRPFQHYENVERAGRGRRPRARPRRPLSSGGTQICDHAAAVWGLQGAQARRRRVNGFAMRPRAPGRLLPPADDTLTPFLHGPLARLTTGSGSGDRAKMAGPIGREHDGRRRGPSA